MTRGRGMNPMFLRTIFALTVFAIHAMAGDGAQPVRTAAALPFYPPLARQARVQGEVVVRMTVTPDGKPTGVEAVSGNPVLERSAVENVQTWAFQPPGVSMKREITFIDKLSPELATGDWPSVRVTFLGARKVTVETDPPPESHDSNPEMR
jgi:TonB family protein